MSTVLAYHSDPFTIEFDAEIIQQLVLPNGRMGVILPITFFYPTGGGQEHDTGMLDDARVTDVLMDDDGNVIHVVDRVPQEGIVRARIDWPRRFAFMQHHSGQHLLSQAIAEALKLETVSANINIDSPSTIDLDCAGDAHLAPAEDLANAVITEDRAIKSYMIPEEQIHRVPFRRSPKVTGQIRVVEIENFDYSACGGTHCTRTGMIGPILVLKTERRAEKLRVYFVAGERALRYFRNYHTIVTALARHFDTHSDGILKAVERQGESLRLAQKELEELRSQATEWQATQLVAQAESFESLKLVTVSFRNRSPQDLRALAVRLQDVPGVVALLASYDGTKVSLTVACAGDTHLNAGELIRRQLAEIGGRGGGDPRLAQGGGGADEQQWHALFESTKDHIRALRDLAPS